tara:strand:+ start:254 stop:628 length:375 start_codon:yes stop_codon:yes gene_type:complete
MNFRLFKILIYIISFFFLTGFVPIASIIGPGFTVLTSGNIYKATAQFMIDQSIKKKTGKDTLTIVKEEIDKKNQKNKFNDELRQLVEKRILITRKKLDDQNFQKLVKKRINVTRSLINLNSVNQ